jgi:hypothetical protein
MYLFVTANQLLLFSIDFRGRHFFCLLQAHIATKTFTTGLPDGLFSYQKSQFGKILEGFVIKNVGMAVW